MYNLYIDNRSVSVYQKHEDDISQTEWTVVQQNPCLHNKQCCDQGTRLWDRGHDRGSSFRGRGTRQLAYIINSAVKHTTEED